jgi:hypothetical protein
MRSPQFALENRLEVMRVLGASASADLVPMHRAVQRLSPLTTVAHVRSQDLAVLRSGADADPPRLVAGGASLGRSRPLASLVILPGTTVFGSDTERQLAAPWIGLRRYSAR